MFTYVHMATVRRDIRIWAAAAQPNLKRLINKTVHTQVNECSDGVFLLCIVFLCMRDKETETKTDNPTVLHR